MHWRCRPSRVRSVRRDLNKNMDERMSSTFSRAPAAKPSVQLDPSAQQSPPTKYRAHTQQDDELLRSLRDGCALAFATLRDRYSHRLFKQIAAITRNREDAEDALQETFLQAFRRIHTFEGRSHIATWLTRIAINTALMKVRKRRSLAEISLDQTLDPEQEPVVCDIPDQTPGPDQIFEKQEQLKQLKDAVGRLRPNLRTAVNLWSTNDCSIVETARNLGVSTSAAKTRVSRARRQLRTLLRTDAAECSPAISSRLKSTQTKRQGARRMHDPAGSAAGDTSHP